MMNLNNLALFKDKEFEDFCKFIYDTAGINLTEKKRSLVTNRLRKRVISNNFSSYNDYFQWVKKNPDAPEFVQMINAITTNISSFYRDPKQFKALNDEVLPIIIESNPGPLKIWSAGCSTGEEPYTIAMQLLSYKQTLKFEITATDLSTHVLELASRGIYTADHFKDVDKGIVSKFIDIKNEAYMVKPNVKNHVKFKKLNLITDPFPKGFDFIFCRNVVIYFDRETKGRLFDRYWESLQPYGFLFLGHSESLFNNTRYKFFKPSIYKRMPK